MSARYTQQLVCPFCYNIMRVDDIDYNFDGNQNNYYSCDTCHAGAFEEIRYKKSVSISYSRGEEEWL